MIKINSEDGLILAVQEGNVEAFESIIRHYATRVYNLAKRLLKTQEDAEEVLQDVFITVYKKIKHFERRSSFSSWIYRITVNAALMKKRSAAKEKYLLLNETTDAQDVHTKTVFKSTATVADEASKRELLAVLEGAIQELPEDFRPVYILRDIDGLSSKEVSRLLHISIPAVKSRLHRSRLLIREKLSMYYTDGSISACSLALEVF